MSLLLKIVRITNIRNENEKSTVKSFLLKLKNEDANSFLPQPGNFIMLWVPDKNLVENPQKITESDNLSNSTKFIESNQKPMSISGFEDNILSITVKRSGKTTSYLHNEYKEEDKLGIVGPLGNSFKITGKNLLFISGGIGAVPLIYLLKNLNKTKNFEKIYFLHGADCDEEIIFREKIQELSSESYFFTIEASNKSCIEGYPTDYLNNLYHEKKIDEIFTCGPWLLMKKVLEFSKKTKIPAQFGLERYMHCGQGYCGFCSINGFLVCKDGPIFTTKQLSKMQNLELIRTPSGRYRNI
ncbi:MAG: hypothetical protein ACFFD2_21440 [Promethearchaeota archaeon]